MPLAFTAFRNASSTASACAVGVAGPARVSSVTASTRPGNSDRMAPGECMWAALISESPLEQKRRCLLTARQAANAARCDHCMSRSHSRGFSARLKPAVTMDPPALVDPRVRSVI
jgi:hypothetical protein